MTNTDDKELNEEFDQFEDLTRQLLAVSKKELDAEKRTNSDPPTAGVSKRSGID